MNKTLLFTAMLCASLWTQGSYAQEPFVLTLEQMYALADAASTTIKAEDARVEQAQREVAVARNGYLPDIDISLSASYIGNSYLLDRDFTGGQTISMPHTGNNFAIRASQLIYAGGAVSNGVAMARLKAELAGVNREAARSRIRFILTAHYLDLYKLRNTLQVYDHSIELARAVIADTKARFAAGVALSNDVTRYELQLKNLELARKRAANSAEILNYDLTTLLGLPSDTKITPDSTLLTHTVPQEGIAHWQQAAQSHAHAVKQSDLSVQMGECGEKLARASRRPRVALVAANHFDGPILNEVPVIDKNINYWYVGVNVSFPLHSLYKAGKEIRRAQSATALSRSRRDEAMEQTAIAVNEAYTRLRETYDEIATLEKNVQLATENYAVTANRYHNEVALVTDMLDASTQLLDAELQLANARIDVIFNYYKLKNTTGDL